MFDAMKRFLAGQVTPAPDAAAAADGEQALQVAACALLLELAHSDDDFSAEERRHIEDVLVRHFDLAPGEAGELIEVAERRRREAIDLYQFTSLINEHYDEGQRLLLAEIMWRIVYADGQLSKHEDALMRKLGQLLDLRPGYLAAARKRAAPGKRE
jgi:uncharacterized tellurite resistance protein B-like protein